ncbi:hypothetical protein ABFX02_14G000700 [Erythranthe guttata]
MEKKLGGKRDNPHGQVESDSNATGIKSAGWDRKDWTWDGHLFKAVKNGDSNGIISSGSDEVLLGDERELDEHRKCADVNVHVNEEAGGSINLNLGEQVFPLMVDKVEERTRKKTKVSGTPSPSNAVCLVEDCKVDLCNVSEYHRRHKVCDVHSKSTSALVGNAVQRFCQQCSRFHVLAEFDEGKRSCRRRLADHNKRRRRTHVEDAVSPTSTNDVQGSNYSLTTLLNIFSNIQASSSDQARDGDLLSNIIRELASLAGSTNPAGLLQNEGTSMGTAVKESTILAGPGVSIPSSIFTQQSTLTDNAQGGFTHNASAPQKNPLLFPKESSNLTKENASDTAVGRVKLNNFDLNNVYDASQDCMEDLHDNLAPEKVGNASTAVPLGLCRDSQRFSRAHNRENLVSSPSQSPSSTSGKIQSCTDRIDFKLFGKDPSHIPLVMRKQILDWLSIRPTDMESYIKPGCIILTVYICMDKNAWEELHCNLNRTLKRLLDSSNDSFWRTGWIYTRVRHHATFVYDGQVVLDTPLPLKNHQRCRISSITPVAVSLSKPAHFVVKGFNLSRSTSRLLCALNGEYLVEENCADLRREADSDEEIHQSLSFSCDMPNTVGRGFIEVEEHGVSSSSFFPFIVAEEDVCSEICTVEKIVGASEALEFVHEMGWLLHRKSLMFRLGGSSKDVDRFPLKRFRWLIEFAMEHEWCAVVKKLLSIMFDGSVDAGKHSSIEVALMDIGLLHQAVGKKKSRSMVKFLLEHKEKLIVEEGGYLFRPDRVGPGGLTPLHVAASLDSCEDVLDALTEDPLSMGIEAWKYARDSTGLTPHDYACLRGHYSYIDLVERKKAQGRKEEYVVVDIPAAAGKLEKKVKRMETEKKYNYNYCRECEKQKIIIRKGYGNASSSVRIYRPAMLSMVAIAAVCVCAALLFKSSPHVMFSLRPFSWEHLKFGSQ